MEAEKLSSKILRLIDVGLGYWQECEDTLLLDERENNYDSNNYK